MIYIPTVWLNQAFDVDKANRFQYRAAGRVIPRADSVSVRYGHAGNNSKVYQLN